MVKKSGITHLVFFTISALALLQCSSPTDIPPHTVFRYNETRNVTSLDPAFARNPQNIWPIQQLFNGLVQLDNDLNVIPEIAKHWTIDSTGTKYIFALRNDVYFHSSPYFEQDTRKVVAQDFVYSFDRLQNPKLGSPGGWVLQQVKKYQALDDHTLEIELKQPFPAFLSLLTMRYCAVVPKEVVEALGEDFRKSPIGTGPFLFKAWEENVKLVLRKNSRYYEVDKDGTPLPYLEAIAIEFLTDSQSEFLRFQKGDFDFLNALDAAYKDELLTPEGKLQPKYKEKLHLQKGAYLNTEYIGFNRESNNPVLQSLAIRKAINLGIDRKKMITYLRNTIGTPANKGFIPDGLKGQSTDRRLTFDPQQAKALVDDYRQSTRSQPTIRLATDANYLDICEYLQRELAKIGIDIAIDLMPTATLRQAKSAGNLEAFRASWIADYPDAENYLSLFYSPNFSPQGPNYTHFQNMEFDRLYTQAMKEPHDKKRELIYAQMDALIMDEFPIAPLYYDQMVRFVQKDVIGLETNALNLLYLKKVRKIPHTNPDATEH